MKKNGPIKNGKINEKHDYYFQMQLQMLVTERSICDFFVWSSVETKRICVKNYEEFCNKLKNKIEQVFL